MHDNFKENFINFLLKSQNIFSFSPLFKNRQINKQKNYYFIKYLFILNIFNKVLKENEFRINTLFNSKLRYDLLRLLIDLIFFKKRLDIIY